MVTWDLPKACLSAEAGVGKLFHLVHSEIQSMHRQAVQPAVTNNDDPLPQRKEQPGLRPPRRNTQLIRVPDPVAHMTKQFINRTSDVENRSTKPKSRLTELD